MPVRIPASELYKTQEEDLREAITTFREHALPATFDASTCSSMGSSGFHPKPLLPWRSDGRWGAFSLRMSLREANRQRPSDCFWHEDSNLPPRS